MFRNIPTGFYATINFSAKDKMANELIKFDPVPLEVNTILTNKVQN